MCSAPDVLNFIIHLLFGDTLSMAHAPCLLLPHMLTLVDLEGPFAYDSAQGFLGAPGAPGRRSCIQWGHGSYLLRGVRGMKRQEGKKPA